MTRASDSPLADQRLGSESNQDTVTRVSCPRLSCSTTERVEHAALSFWTCCPSVVLCFVPERNFSIQSRLCSFADCWFRQAFAESNVLFFLLHMQDALFLFFCTTSTASFQESLDL